MKKQLFTTEYAGKTLTAEFNDLAAHANGSVLITYGETVLLVTAVMSKKVNGAPYFPLSVEFEEKFYAAGQILGSRFQRREGRPSDEATLSARIVDRTIRPLFNHAIRHDIQVVISVLAIGEDDPDVASVIGASLALGVSDIPWAGPVAAIRIGRTRNDGHVLVNPTYQERTEGLLDTELFACGQAGLINMVETAAYEVDESTITSLLTAAVIEHEKIEAWQRDIITKIGKPKQALSFETVPEATTAMFSNTFATLLATALWSGQPGKDHIYSLQKDFVVAAGETGCSEALAARYFEEQIDEELHRGAVKEGKRADGRTTLGFDGEQPLQSRDEVVLARLGDHLDQRRDGPVVIGLQRDASPPGLLGGGEVAQKLLGPAEVEQVARMSRRVPVGRGRRQARRGRAHGAPADGVQERRPRDDRALPFGGEGDRSADHDLQQRAGLQGGHFSRDVRRDGRRAEVRVH